MTLKICLLGDGAVGKTCLIQRFVKNIFREDYIPTIGTRTSRKKIIIEKPELQKNFNLDLIIWDILGQISLRKRLHPTYLKGAKGAFLVCDLTRGETLEHLDDWVDSLSSEWRMVPSVFVANKSDLGNEYEFGKKEIDSIASTYDSNFYTTSAKTGENVENAFTSLGEKIIEDLIKKSTSGAGTEKND
jgi:small GTP-binding protein